MDHQLYPKHPERAVFFPALLVKLAILKFDNCATANRIVNDVRAQADADVKPGAVLSVLNDMVEKGHVFRVEDAPDHPAAKPAVFFVLSPTGYAQTKSVVWMIDNMTPADIVGLID